MHIRWWSWVRVPASTQNRSLLSCYVQKEETNKKQNQEGRVKSSKMSYVVPVSAVTHKSRWSNGSHRGLHVWQEEAPLSFRQKEMGNVGVQHAMLFARNTRGDLGVQPVLKVTKNLNIYCETSNSCYTVNVEKPKQAQKPKKI